MKKFFTFFLAIAIITILFSACGTKKDSKPAPLNVDGLSGFEMYSQAAQTLNSVGSSVMNNQTLIKMKMGMDSMMDVKVNTVTETVMHSETDLDVRITSLTTAEDEDVDDIETVIYYRAGNMYIYMEAWGMGMKLPMPLEDIMHQLKTNGALEFPEEAVLSENIKAVDKGTEISLLLSGNVMSNLINEITKGMLGNMGIESDEMYIEMSDIEVVALLDSSNNLSELKTLMQMDIDVDNVKMSMELDSAIEIVKIGGVTINFPAELDEYLDMAGMM
ncbi:MAG: hypothetical protein FWD19_02175 [Defluviitaleaceae bacterium]|nr:hypothetical protein [Defluviitaleaceae bacterium]